MSTRVVASTTLSPTMSDSTFPVMREALQQALHLRFAQALDRVVLLEASALSPLAAPLTRGIIAYFQTHWQTRQHPPAHHIGHQAFARVLREGHGRLKQAPAEHEPGELSAGCLTTQDHASLKNCRRHRRADSILSILMMRGARR
jgi:hypothetical protein